MTAESFPRFDLGGQVAMVTGAARGLGRAISLALANAGADVVLGLREVTTAGDLAEQIEGIGRRALRLQMDVTDLAQISEAVGDAVARFERIDILVNNAGLDRRTPPRTSARTTSTSPSP